MKMDLEKWKKDHPGYVDLTNGKGDDRNYYDEKTGDHYYDGHAWSKELWDEWLNELND